MCKREIHWDETCGYNVGTCLGTRTSSEHFNTEMGKCPERDRQLNLWALSTGQTWIGELTHLPTFLTLFLASQVILLELFVWGLTLLGPLLSLSTREKSESSLTNCMIIPLFTGELKAQSVDWHFPSWLWHELWSSMPPPWSNSCELYQINLPKSSPLLCFSLCKSWIVCSVNNSTAWPTFQLLSSSSWWVTHILGNLCH